MNSGVRLSVAILILIMVLVGLYYARLDDGTEIETPPETTQEVTESEPAPPVFREPEPVTEPAADPIETSEWTPEDEIANSAQESTDESPDSSDAEEFAEFELDADELETLIADDEDSEPSSEEQASPVDGSAVDEGSEPAEEMMPEATEPSAESENEAGQMATASDSAEQPNEAASADESSGDTSSPMASRSTRPGRAIEAAGVGGHRIAGVSLTPADAELARTALAAAPADAMVVPVGDGLGWVAVPAGTTLDGLSDEAIASSSDDGRAFVLIRNDAAGSMNLSGRVERADVTSLPESDRHDLLVRVSGSEIDSIRDASREFVGHPIAWIADGRLIAIQTLRIPISGRAKILLATDEDTAIRFASRLMAPESEMEPAPRAARDTSRPNSTPSSDSRPGGGERPAGAGELPPDMYEIYEVKSGDTPSSIAAAWFGDANQVSLVLKANPNLDPTQLQIGDTLRLPPKNFRLWTVVASPEEGKPRIHIVQSGETLSHIAQAAYGQGSRWPEIYEANKTLIGADPKNLKVGMELRIP